MYCEQCGKKNCGNAVGIVDNAQSQQSVKQEISIPASHEAKQEQKYVGFWARLGAYFLDYILILIFSAVPSLVLYFFLRYFNSTRISF